MNHVHLAVSNTYPNLDAELSVLGGLMLNNRVYISVSDILDETDFYYTEHQFIYRGIKTLSEQNKPCDIIILSEWLESHGRLESIGGLSYLGKLVKHTPSAVNVLTYAELVRKFSLQRQLDKAYKEQRPASIIQHLEDALSEVEKVRRSPGFFDQLRTGEAQPTNWLIDGILPVGLSILASKPKVGKSWLALQIANCISVGGKLFGQESFISQRGEIIYLALEDDISRLKNRCEKQGSYPTGVYYTKKQGYPKIGNGFEQQLRKDIEMLSSPKLVVVDTLTKVSPLRQSMSYQEDYQLIETLQKIHVLYPKLAVLLVHHQRKESSNDNTDTLIGTTGLSGSVDNLLFLKKEHGRTTLSTTGKDVNEQNLALRFDKTKGTWQYLGNEEELHLLGNQGQILEAIQKHNAETRSEIEQLVEMNNNVLKTTLNRLVNKNILKILGKKGREYKYGLVR